MDAEIILVRYCKKKGIDINKYSDDVWEEMVQEFEDEVDDYLDWCYSEGKFNNFLDELFGE